jgi:hypothetical protein
MQYIIIVSIPASMGLAKLLSKLEMPVVNNIDVHTNPDKG